MSAQQSQGVEWSQGKIEIKFYHKMYFLKLQELLYKDDTDDSGLKPQDIKRKAKINSSKSTLLGKENSDYMLWYEIY